MAFTFFFRDSQVLEMLIEKALPQLCGQSCIRVWDAGCAHGPEAYTTAILMRERMSEILFRNVKIFATDVDPAFASKVNLGTYPEGELKRIPAGLFERYFQAASEPGHFQVADEIRSKLEFSVHDLLSLKPIRDGFSLIICKNVLLHFNERQRCDVLRMFHASMRKDGMLAMEHTQKMPEELLPLFQQIAPNAQVFKKLEIPATSENEIISGPAWRIDLPDGRHLPHRGSKSQVMTSG
jgi:chemotaxis protein methyltransferase CheR